MFRVRAVTGSKQNQVSKALNYYLRVKPGTVSAGLLENATYPGTGMSVPLVGLWMEFGTRVSGEDGVYHSPPRPFLRNTARKYRKEWTAIYIAGMRRRQTSEQVLKRIGARMAGDIRRTIVNFTEPPNAPSTIAKKGKDSPLRDTGVLLRSISWELENAVRNRGVEHKRVG